jgi:hypothetical protein
VIYFLLALACSGEPEPAGCQDVTAGPNQEECRFQEALQLQGNRAELSRYLREISDESSRDLIAIRLAVRDPFEFGWLCDGVSTRTAGDRCRQVLGRPHLRAPRRGD